MFQFRATMTILQLGPRCPRSPPGMIARLFYAVYLRLLVSVDPCSIGSAFLVHCQPDNPTNQQLHIPICASSSSVRILVPSFPMAGEPTPANVDQPSFKLVYDDTIEFRLTSNRNEMKDIVRLRLCACISISISCFLHSSR